MSGFFPCEEAKVKNGEENWTDYFFYGNNELYNEF